MSWMSMFVSAVVTIRPFLSSIGWCRSTSERSVIATAFQGGEKGAIRRAQRRVCQQVGAALKGAPQGFATPPGGDRTVVPGEQDLRNPQATEFRRPRVLGILEEAIAE